MRQHLAALMILACVTGWWGHLSESYNRRRPEEVRYHAAVGYCLDLHASVSVFARGSGKASPHWALKLYRVHLETWRSRWDGRWWVEAYLESSSGVLFEWPGEWGWSVALPVTVGGAP